MEFFVGVDLGQMSDFTAYAVLQRFHMPHPQSRRLEYAFDVPHLHRFPLGTPYPVIVEHIRDLMTKPPLGGRSVLVVDGTGVGRPVVDMFQEVMLNPVDITITCGTEVTRGKSSLSFNVPKRDLVSVCSVLLQNRRLRIAAALEHAETLKNELLNFKVKITLQGNDTYGAEAPWREGNHDDLVLATGVGAWYGMRYYPGSYVAGRPDPKMQEINRHLAWMRGQAARGPSV